MKTIMWNANLFYRDLQIERIRPFFGKPVIKVLTGQRRVGKSSLLRCLRQELGPLNPGLPIVEFSTEDDSLLLIRDAQAFLAWIDTQVPGRGACILLADEIQELEGFDQALAMLLARGNCDIYCTGSNARFLSKDILGRLSGRAVEFRIEALTYPEFLTFHQRQDSDEALALYLRFGGMPFLHHLPLEDAVVFEYLKNIYNTILYKDVIGRTGIRNINLLERLVRYLADTTGSLVSAKRISDFLKSQRSTASPGSILEYLDSLCDACFVHRVKRIDLKGKKVFEIGEKYYFTDLGLRHSVIPYRSADLGKILENAIHQHLCAHGWTVFVGQDDQREIDFVAERAGSRIYVQVALQLTEPATIEREFGNLLALRDAWPKYVVSLDPFASGQDGVKHVPLRRFLSQGEGW